MAQKPQERLDEYKKFVSTFIQNYKNILNDQNERVTRHDDSNKLLYDQTLPHYKNPQKIQNLGEVQNQRNVVVRNKEELKTELASLNEDYDRKVQLYKKQCKDDPLHLK